MTSIKKRLPPKKLEQLISFVEEQGLDWTVGRRGCGNTSTYWAAVVCKRDTPEEEPEAFSSKGTWETPVEALSDAYARYAARASKYKPISEQMGFPIKLKT
ncbi:hypothetical protein NDI44_27390 [Trichocoleus sp. DQ-A3]|uniref:hypothetical protein n=1 Tax=Cyanophyceae TaxID=3028117 RepID=UPI001689DB66|nr:hypothetical protein [Coleofasciculus sp. FACHB-125]MBD1903716.1 hypothetical protein [Coleofasciculus sp. FACHB-125]